MKEKVVSAIIVGQEKKNEISRIGLLGYRENMKENE